MKKYEMTKEGLLKAQKELEKLQQKRLEIIEKIKHAKEMGDLKENSEYHEAKNDMAFNESEILRWEDLIRNAKVVDNAQTEFVTLGSNIKVESKLGVREFTIVGASEANPLEGKISHESPLGSSFMNRKAGEEFEVETPAGPQIYKIVEIMSESKQERVGDLS